MTKNQKVFEKDRVLPVREAGMNVFPLERGCLTEKRIRIQVVSDKIMSLFVKEVDPLVRKTRIGYRAIGET